MCDYCVINYGADCGIPGMDCCDDGASYLSPEEADLICNPPAIESEYSMSDVKVEVAVDDNGIITKQSEVYVWNDTVFASYKSALAASKKSIIYSKLIGKYAAKNYPTYTPQQIATLVTTWSKSPTAYSIPLDICFESIAELLAE